MRAEAGAEDEAGAGAGDEGDDINMGIEMEEGGSVANAASFDDTPLLFSVERIDFDRVKERIKNALQACKNPPRICPKSRKTASTGRS